MRDLIEPELRALQMVIRNEPVSRTKLTRHLQRYDCIGPFRDRAINELIERNLIKAFKPAFLIDRVGPRPTTYESTAEGREWLQAYVNQQNSTGAI